jgi:hypothetical protein
LQHRPVRGNQKHRRRQRSQVKRGPKNQGRSSAFFVLYLWFLVDGFGLLGEPVCRTEVQGRLAGLSGFDFEISETSCFFDPAVSVFVSKAGEKQKTLLFKYTPIYVGPYPTVTSIDEHAVQISVSPVSSIFCRKDKWETLTVKYGIGVVDYSSRDGPDEC